MKKFFILAAAAALMMSCSTASPKLVTTASGEKMDATLLVCPMCADLDVAAERVSYTMRVVKTVNDGGGFDNAVKTAIKECLEKNGNADVMVDLQTQAKYNADGVIESITISGHPAKYVNFKPITDMTMLEFLMETENAKGEQTGAASILSLKKK